MKTSEIKVGQSYRAKKGFCEVVKVTTLNTEGLFADFSFKVLSKDHPYKDVDQEANGEYAFPLSTFLTYYDLIDG